MKTTLNKIGDNQTKLTIELDIKDLKPFIDRTEGFLARDLKLKGFRKGKIPSAIARKEIGENKIREQAMDLAMRESFVKVINKNKIDLLKTGDLKILKNDKDLLKYEATLTIYPEVTLGEYKGVEVKKNPTDATDDEVDKTLQQVLKTRAKYDEIDGPIGKGNRIEVDFTVKLDEKMIEGGESKNHPLVVGDGGFIPGFEDQLIGLKKGEEKSFNLTVPDNYHRKELSGKKLDFSVTINKIQRVTIAKLDDKFAKELGDFKDLNALKKNLIKGISMEKDFKEKERIRLAVLSKVAEDSKVNIPQDLIDNQLDKMLSDFDANLQKQGMELGLYLAQIKKTKADLRKDWLKEANRQVKLSLVLRAIGHHQEINVDEKEVNEAFNERLGQFRNVQEAKSTAGDLNKFRESVRSLLINEKIFQFLENNSVIS